MKKKEKGNDPDYGYFGSHHFDINIDGLIIELQVMTNKMWNYKEEAHKIYMQNRNKGGPDKFYSKVSKNLFQKANEHINYDNICFSIEEIEDVNKFKPIVIEEHLIEK